MHQRPVRVAVNDYVGVVGGKEPVRRRATELVTVADVDAHALDLEVQHLRQIRIGWIVDVAVDRLHRRELAKLGEDTPGADIPRMEDQASAAKRRNRFGPEESVCVGDEAYDHRAGVE